MREENILLYDTRSVDAFRDETRKKGRQFRGTEVSVLADQRHPLFINQKRVLKGWSRGRKWWIVTARLLRVFVNAINSTPGNSERSLIEDRHVRRLINAITVSDRAPAVKVTTYLSLLHFRTRSHLRRLALGIVILSFYPEFYRYYSSCLYFIVKLTGVTILYKWRYNL